jgi:plastocyanin
MHRKVLIAAALTAAFALPFAAHRAIAQSTPGPSATDTNVSIDNYAFKAPSVTITAGSAVVWKNADDDPHTVTADDGSFDSKGLGQGDTYRHVFAKAGTYPYHCSAHPYMKGVVVVVESR